MLVCIILVSLAHKYCIRGHWLGVPFQQLACSDDCVFEYPQDSSLYPQGMLRVIVEYIVLEASILSVSKCACV